MPTPRDAFIEATFWHGSRERADAVLRQHPELRSADIHLAAIVGDDAAVERFLAADRDAARSRSGPRMVEPLVHLCFSVYLRERAREASFVRAATLLLDAGADVHGGFFDESHEPSPGLESLLYGAAGVGFSPGVTRLLLERGADPNDDEVPYHSVEGPDNDAFRVLLDSGRMNAESLSMMLLRKTDWHDLEGVRLVLDRGIDPNTRTRWGGKTALHNAVISNNALAIIDLLLDRGADPLIAADWPARGADRSVAGKSSVAMAARFGRADALRSFERRGFSIALDGVDGLIAACALDDGAAIDALLARDPSARNRVLAEGAVLLAQFASTANAAGVARLIDLGVPVDARYGGNGYFGTPPNSTALHVAAWHSWPRVVEVLLARGADQRARDGNGRTPRELAERAAVDSFWMERAQRSGVTELLDQAPGGPPRP